MQNDLNPDFQDFIKSLTSQSVDFILVGAHALAFHGVARYTEDLDVWVDRNKVNSRRVQRAMADFGIPIPEETDDLLVQERKMIRFGNKPRCIKILNFLDGCEYELAASRTIQESLGGVPVRILSLEDFVATKRASGRPKDRSDLVLLREAIGPLPGDGVSTYLGQGQIH